MKKIYWDTGIFIHWLEDCKNLPQEDRQGIEATVASAEKREIIIVTSVLTRSEVLWEKRGMAKMENFILLLRSPKVREVDVNSKIANKVNDLRCKLDGSKWREHKLIDLFHVATAIISGVDELHTVDKDDLLKLNRKPEVDGLQIIKPPRLALWEAKEQKDQETVAELEQSIETEVQQPNSGDAQQPAPPPPGKPVEAEGDKTAAKQVQVNGNGDKNEKTKGSEQEPSPPGGGEPAGLRQDSKTPPPSNTAAQGAPQEEE